MAIIFTTFAVLMFLGIPIYYVLGGASLAYLFANDLPAWTIIQRQFVGMNSFVQVAVPLFILAGNIMDEGGTLDRIIHFAKVCVGRFKGGMAHVNVVASMMFAGVTGSAVADVAALGPLEIQMMTDQGYDKEYSAALTCAAASIGPIIPPSLPLIMYGVVSGTSVGDLLMAGIVPGILIGLVLMAQIAYLAVKHGFPTSEAYPIKVIFKELPKALSAIAMPVVILVGIYTGFFTPTEAAGVACILAFVLGKFVYKEIAWSDIPKILVKTAKTLGTCSAIFAIASCFSYVITFENIPKMISEAMLSISNNKFVLLLLVNIALLIIGCFMEGISAILITAPMILPALTAVGVDPIHLGVIMTINTTLGLLTPPLGLSLFMASSVTDIPVLNIAKKAMPMFALLVVTLLVLTYFDQIILFLPKLMLGA
jgi:C4-dicarboxylate transporter DctM subunit